MITSFQNKMIYCRNVFLVSALVLLSLSCSDDPASTDDNIETGTLMDIDGNVYQTVRIGDQWWMAENLKVRHYRNGDEIPNVANDSIWAGLSSGAYCAYDNDSTNIEIYGLLYNWYAVDDSIKIAPQGWHVPTDEDWTELENYLGSDAGGKLKETGIIHWNSPNTGATNSSGFIALPCGYRDYDGTFHDQGSYGDWWSATENSSSFAWYRYLDCNSSDVVRASYLKKNGFSVRCVKD